MKLFTCMAYADPRKLQYLAQVLKAQEHLMDEVHVCVITQLQGADELAAIHAAAPPNTPRFKVEVYNEGCDRLPSPWLLTWVHKKLLREKYEDPSYTHFMCIEDDMEVTQVNIEYWLEGREALRPYELFPSFLRVEWNTAHREWAMTESIAGDRYSIGTLPRLALRDGYGYINLPRTYQGMFLYDRELMLEHIQSASFDLETFVPNWRQRILRTDWPLGLTEAAVAGLTDVRVKAGCLSRNFIPYYTKYQSVDPCCFVHHLPDKYTNMAGSEQGRVFVRDLLTA